MAQEFTEADLSPRFRSNGTSMPANPQYLALAAGGFADYRLAVDGLVEKPASLSLAELRALPSRTQITRHDCVEGWSAIGKWKGARLSALLEAVQPKPQARFVVFHCADPMEDDGTSPYYESIDLEDAFHPQTILAYDLNDRTLPIPNGAPVRLARRTTARLQAREVCHAHRARRELREDPRRQGRLLGRSRLRMVGRHLAAAARADLSQFWTVKEQQMIKVALLVRLEAKPGKESAVEEFLRGGLALVQQEPRDEHLVRYQTRTIDVRHLRHVPGRRGTPGTPHG